MSVERGIRFELLARLCPNATGAEVRSVCTEAGMYAIRARRKVCTVALSRFRPITYRGGIGSRQPVGSGLVFVVT